MNHSSRNTILLLFLVALVPRLGLLGVYKGTSVAEQYDARSYEAVAANIVNGNGFIDVDGKPTMVRPPVYPLYLASMHLLFGPDDTAARILQCFIDAGSAVLVFCIAGMLLPLPAALLAGYLYALYPPAILYSNIKLSECLFIFLLLGEVFLLVKGLVTRQGRLLAYSGVVHGAAVLCRPLTILFPFFLLPFLFFFYRKMLKSFILSVVIGSTIISVWTVRNYVQFKVFMPVNVGTGYSLYLVTMKDIWAGDRLLEPDLNVVRPDLTGMTRCEWEKIMTRETRQMALHHPLTYGAMVARNVVRWWTIPVGKVLLERVSPGLARLYKFAFILFLGVAAFGFFAALRSSFSSVLPVALYLVYILVMFAPFAAAPRYRLPFEPLIMIFFSYAMYTLYKSFQRDK